MSENSRRARLAGETWMTEKKSGSRLRSLEGSGLLPLYASNQFYLRLAHRRERRVRSQRGLLRTIRRAGLSLAVRKPLAAPLLKLNREGMCFGRPLHHKRSAKQGAGASSAAAGTCVTVGAPSSAGSGSSSAVGAASFAGPGTSCTGTAVSTAGSVIFSSNSDVSSSTGAAGSVPGT